ncbi:MAG: aldo/keto reductase [Lachnospiraceae bacterium]|nr:aldo/keto reductase [Lachnospiraceae bacterium]
MKITLGRTNINTNFIGFGALPIQRVTTEYAGMLLKKAYDAGVTFFDTARAYTDSEAKIGLALNNVRGNIYLATKTTAGTGEELTAQLETSLSLLKTDYIDLYQLHNPQAVPRPGDGTGLYEAALKAKAEGKIRHIGITNHRLQIAEEAVLSGLYDTLQFPFSYLASEAEVKLVNLCREKKIGFIAMKALAGGLITRADAAYAYLAQFENVLPIWGVQREKELDEFIGFMSDPPVLSAEISALIEKDRAQLAGNFCRGCAYCMPCPVGIQINNCARMSQLIRRSPSAFWVSEEGQKMMDMIEKCVGCNSCIEKCPYSLNTPLLLKQNLDDYKNIITNQNF